MRRPRYQHEQDPPCHRSLSSSLLLNLTKSSLVGRHEAALDSAEGERQDGRALRPRVSVGIPVFNRADTLRRAIESVLGQSFADFEVVVSDNASTDGAADLCRR